jgi:hypothetical protein
VGCSHTSFACTLTLKVEAIPFIHQTLSELYDLVVQKNTIHSYLSENLKCNIIFGWHFLHLSYWISFLSCSTPRGTWNILTNISVAVMRIKSLTVIGESKLMFRFGEVDSVLRQLSPVYQSCWSNETFKKHKHGWQVQTKQDMEPNTLQDTVVSIAVLVFSLAGIWFGTLANKITFPSIYPPWCLYAVVRRVWTFNVWLILSSPSACLTISRVSFAFFPRFLQNLMLFFGQSIVKWHEARYMTPNKRT